MATKETLGGILLLEARDLNHAIALLSKHPAARIWPTTFEIRPANEELNRLVSERSAAVLKRGDKSSHCVLSPRLFHKLKSRRRLPKRLATGLELSWAARQRL